MKSQVLHTVWCNISCEAAGEIWHWSLSGLKGLTMEMFSDITMFAFLANLFFHGSPQFIPKKQISKILHGSLVLVHWSHPGKLLLVANKSRTLQLLNTHPTTCEFLTIKCELCFNILLYLFVHSLASKGSDLCEWTVGVLSLRSSCIPPMRLRNWRLTIVNNYSPKWRWKAVDIYRAASARWISTAIHRHWGE